MLDSFSPTVESDFQEAVYVKKGPFWEKFQGAHPPWTGETVGQSVYIFTFLIFNSSKERRSKSNGPNA